MINLDKAVKVQSRMSCLIRSCYDLIVYIFLNRFWRGNKFIDLSLTFTLGNYRTSL